MSRLSSYSTCFFKLRRGRTTIPLLCFSPLLESGGIPDKIVHIFDYSSFYGSRMVVVVVVVAKACAFESPSDRKWIAGLLGWH